MKKLLLLIAMFGFFTYAMTSCGGKQEKAESQDGEYSEYETAEEKPAAPKEEATPEALISQGQTAIDGSDCRTCHHNTNKLIGPSYEEVAKKYDFTEANVAYLADKIIKGGSGVWGEIPMTPHVDLTEADARKMAMYVLSLDGEAPQL